MRALSVVLILLVVLVGCRRSSQTEESPQEYFAKLEKQWKPPTERSNSPVTAAQLAESSQHMGIRFSSNTIALGFRKETGGMDTAIFLKVRMPSNEVERFIAASPLAKERFRENGAALPGSNSLLDPWWWNFTGKRQVRYGQASLPKAEVLHMLIDPENRSSVIVYLVWHQT